MISHDWMDNQGIRAEHVLRKIVVLFPVFSTETHRLTHHHEEELT
jgi:hypothetical protein